MEILTSSVEMMRSSEEEMGRSVKVLEGGMPWQECGEVGGGWKRSGPRY